jgi:release factor glutamine methyltransferase
MKTILEIITLSTEYLTKKGIFNARRQSEDLVSDVLNLSRMELYTSFETPLSENELATCRENLSRRGRGEPLQYIHGAVDFFGCKIKVDPHVLIPRQETEVLIDMIVKQLEKDEQQYGSLKGKVLFDVCTGSGCLGISLKKKFPDLKVYLSDISYQALEIAKQNALQNEVDVECLIGDLLQPFNGKKCDYFLCNPPYIAEKEYENLEREVKGFEPKLALVSGVTGYEFYEKLAGQLPGYLNSSARVFLEMGRGQGKHILNLFIDKPWKNANVQKDWSSHDRFFFLEIE